MSTDAKIGGDCPHGFQYGDGCDECAAERVAKAEAEVAELKKQRSCKHHWEADKSGPGYICYECKALDIDYPTSLALTQLQQDVRPLLEVLDSIEGSRHARFMALETFFAKHPEMKQ